MRSLVGIALSAVIAVVAWFTIGQGIKDRIDDSNARAGGGGPANERIVSPQRFTPIVEQFRKQVGSEARLVSVTLRPDTAEFVAFERGRARGYRYRNGHDGVKTFEVGGSGRAGQPDNEPFPLRLLDPRAPQRIASRISGEERGDFLLSIGDLQRADSGKVVWVLRGRIGEDRGVAYSAEPDGSRAKPYDPSTPELSKGAALGQCIQAAHNDPLRLQRCVSRYGR